MDVVTPFISVICHSDRLSTGSPVHVLMLSVQAVRCLPTELHILCWSELGRLKLSPMLATAHYSWPDSAVGLVAQCELSGYIKLV